MINLDDYCTRCGSDQFVGSKGEKHPSMRWCGLCWKWQKPLDNALKRELREAREALEDAVWAADYLVGQQAMPDDGYKPRLERARAVLAGVKT